MIFFVLISLVKDCNTLGGQFECGANGRFEYCIDGIPGCVVGCHCYPGYYFDTDTKICEPNTKLTQDFRRHYVVESGQKSNGFPGANSDATTPTEPGLPTTTHAMEQHVDEIAKDTGDISDWLYNQFFKTIENQVINKTDNNDFLKKPSRRSGGPPKRKFRKKKKDRKAMKQGLRRKLLRISEDDSLFDEDSDSRSDDTSSSSSWESWGYEPPDKQRLTEPNDDNRDHGHRKIVVYSKKPKPPLPSFIFLPNIETPFYPPIGLPAAPIPMYPMVPVPPINPFFPQPDDGCEQNSTTGTVTVTITTTGDSTTRMTTAATTSTTTALPATSKTESPAVTDDLPPTGEPATETAIPGTTYKPASRNRLPKSLKRRNKILQRLKQIKDPKQILQNMGRMVKKSRDPKNKHFTDDLQDATRFDVNSLLQNPIMDENPTPEQDDLLPYEDDVDFKYLTQLIHRVDVNETMPTKEFNLRGENSIKSPLTIRRNKTPIMPGLLQAGMVPRRTFKAKPDIPDDSYYSNLGRQIAALIREIHPNDVDIDQINSRKGLQLFLNGNTFSPHSYWERFVRSPLRVDLTHYSKLKDQTASKEMLFNLENQAQVAASSSSFLNLPQLEDVISAIERIQDQALAKELNQKYTRTAPNSLNVSLLPKLQRRSLNVSIKPNTRNTVITNRTKKMNVNIGKSGKKGYRLPQISKFGRSERQNYTNNNYIYLKSFKLDNKFRNMYGSTTILSHPRVSIPNLKSTQQPNLANNKNSIIYRYSKKKSIYDNAATISRKSDINVRYKTPKKSSYFLSQLHYFI